MIPALEISDLTKRYGSVLALDGIALAIERKSVLAILGPNGAGKSTLFGCLLGLIHPTRGRILWQGNAIGDTQRASIGYMPERVALYPSSTVFENGLFFAGLKHQPRTELERQLDRVGLLSLASRKVRQLSKGMLQRLGLAIALCGQPELLILDEPFNGLDPVLLEGLQAILREERARGATLLISTHTISAIEPWRPTLLCCWRANSPHTPRSRNCAGISAPNNCWKPFITGSRASMAIKRLANLVGRVTPCAPPLYYLQVRWDILAESQRDSAPKPRVARNELSWELVSSPLT